jgi:hypothetical protein
MCIIFEDCSIYMYIQFILLNRALFSFIFFCYRYIFELVPRIILLWCRICLETCIEDEVGFPQKTELMKASDKLYFEFFKSGAHAAYDFSQPYTTYGLGVRSENL